MSADAPAATTLATDADLLRLATSGSVDDGKSTLIGRLLYDSKQILDDQLEAVERTSAARGDEYLNLALLTDGLRAEREQGITIDVAYRYFATPRREFIIADTPGHVRYTRNMVTGASNADLSLVLVDARHGLVEQSKRHAYIAALLGVPHLVVCVNKMDLIGHDRRAFERIAADVTLFADRLGIEDTLVIPISALHGDNVVNRSETMYWYGGPTVLEHLETVTVAREHSAARFPVQLVIRPMSAEHHDYRGYAGQLAGGPLRTGDEVVVLPSGARSRITGIDVFESALAEARPPQSVTLRLADDLDISRGDLIAPADAAPTVARGLAATLCWMSEDPLAPGARYSLKHATRTLRATVERIDERVDVESLASEPATQLALNEIGQVKLRLTAPLAFDPYGENRTTGGFILIDDATGDTVAAGMVTAPWEPQPARSENVVWQRSRLTRAERWERLGQRGAVIWLTGLPASGKSTIASALEQRLTDSGHSAYVLDGDNLRHGLNGDLGFGPDARRENIRRTAHVAAILADAGTIVLVSLVSPYAADRERARSLVEEAGLEFREVHVATPLAECEARDPKGHYARARRGEIEQFTGVSAPYEAPSSPDVAVGRQSVGAAVEAILGTL